MVDFSQVDTDKRLINPTSFGASESATPDKNQVAFQGALDQLKAWGGGTLIIPGNTFNIGGSLSFSNGGTPQKNTNVRIVGGTAQSRLHFKQPTSGLNQGASGLSISADGIHLEGFTLSGEQTQATISPLLSILRTTTQGTFSDSDPKGRSSSRLVLRDLILDGDGKMRPDAYLRVRGGQNGLFDNIIVRAFREPYFEQIGATEVEHPVGPAYGAVSRGIDLTHNVNGGLNENAGFGEITFRNCHVLGCETGFYVRGGNGALYRLRGTERINFTDCSARGVQTGVFLDTWSAPFSALVSPGCSWKGGYIDAATRAFRLTYTGQFKISDGLFQLDAASPTKEGFILLSNCRSIDIHDNLFKQVAVSGPDTGAEIYGVAMDNGTDLCQVHDNSFFGFQPGSGAIYNPGTGRGNRAHHNAKEGSGIVLAGAIDDEGYNTLLPAFPAIPQTPIDYGDDGQDPPADPGDGF